MKLLGSTKSKITKNTNDGNVLYLWISEAVLVHCNIIKNDNQQNSIILFMFFHNKSLVNY